MSQLKRLQAILRRMEAETYAEKLSQFTIDLHESLDDRVQAQIESPISVATDDLIAAIIYDMENVVEIMRPGLPDHLLLSEILQALRKLEVSEAT